MKKHKETPFSISPNPSNLYLTSGLKAAIHKVKYVIDNARGLTAILGDVGMGKSSVLRLIYSEYLSREDATVRLIPAPNFTTDFVMIKAITGNFGLPPKKSRYDQEQEFYKYLL